MVKRSWAWKYFKDNGKGKDAKCEVKLENDEKCGKELQSAAKGLAEHLKRVHKIFPDENNEEMIDHNDDENYSHKKQKTIKDYLRQPLIEESVAYAAAVENHSFHLIATSKLIQAGLMHKFPNSAIPKSAKSVINMTYDYYLKVQEGIIYDIDSLIQCGKKFSISLDEWTSIGNNKYVNINLHFRNDEKMQYINTGLVKINGKCTAEQLVQLVKSHLATFHIDTEKDVISCSGDGAALMKAFGRQIYLPYIICMNHTIHLSVVDVIYKKYNVKSNNENMIAEIEVDCDDEDIDDNIDDDDDEENFSNDNEEVQFSDLYGSTIKNMRKIIRIFKLSAVKNHILKKIMLRNYGKVLKLILDCKTRWSSLYFSMKRFLEVLDSVLEALEHREISKTYLWSEHHTHALQEILSVMEPAKIAIDSLSKDSTDLIEAEAIIDFLLKEVGEQSNILAKEFFSSLLSRLNDRRDPKVIGLIFYLLSPKVLQEKSQLSYPSKTAIKKFGKELLERMYDDVDSTSIQTVCHNVDQMPSTSSAISLFDRLNKSLNAMKEIKASSSSDFHDSTKNDIDEYDKHGKKTKKLKALIDALLSIPPTSTRCERNFSLSSHIVSKQRSQMSDKHVNALCFLKSYFLNKKQ